MADFTQIIQEINDDINTNGVGAITGAKLNEVLRDMIAAVNDEKQDPLTIDSTPTEDSTNPVQSGGVYDALQDKPTIYYIPIIQEIPPTILSILRVGDILRSGGEHDSIAVVCQIDNNDIYFVSTDGDTVETYLYRNGVFYDYFAYQLSDFANKFPGATQGNLAGLDSDGNLTDSGIAASDVATTSDVNGKLSAPATAGTSGQVLTSDGQGGQSWQTPQSGGVTDVTVGGTSVVSDGVAAVPAIPTVPNSVVNATSQQDGTVVLTMANGDTIIIDLNHQHPNYYSKVAETTQPSGGMLPDVTYKLGTLTGATTFSFAAAVSGNENHYYFTFTSGTTAVVPTWPASITSWDGNCVDSTTGLPVIAARKTYEVSVIDGNAIIKEW